MNRQPWNAGERTQSANQSKTARIRPWMPPVAVARRAARLEVISPGQALKHGGNQLFLRAELPVQGHLGDAGPDSG
jgi:hypothetical protein